MNRTKALTIVLYLVVAAYTMLAIYGNTLADPKRGGCNNQILNLFVTWDSGCYYSAYFLANPSKLMLDFEHQKLTRFLNRGGYSQHVKWYRSVFYRRFQTYFKLTDEDIHNEHRSYTNARPRSLMAQVRYIEHLTTASKTVRAQSVLNEYCDQYIPSELPNIVLDIRERLRKKRVSLDWRECLLKVKVTM